MSCLVGGQPSDDEKLFCGNGATILQQVSAAAYNVLTDLALDKSIPSADTRSISCPELLATRETLLLSSSFLCVWGGRGEDQGRV